MSARKHPNSLLFKISGMRLRKPSWLLGTMHMVCAEDFFVREKVIKALSKCTHYYMEVDLGSADEVDIMHAGQPEAVDYFQGLDALQQQELDVILMKDFGISLDEAHQLSPVTLLNKMATDALGCDDYKVAEVELLFTARQMGIHTGGLETAQEQLSIAEQVFDGEEVLRQFKCAADYKTVFAKMVDAYRHERLHELASLVADERFMSDTAYNTLVIERNKNWAQMIPELIQDKSAFIAVGAGHLPGAWGVINLLQQQGFAVNPVYR